MLSHLLMVYPNQLNQYRYLQSFCPFLVLFQTFLPVVFDQGNFIHKLLLEIYINMKDVALDVIDDWDEIKRLAAERSEEGGENEVVVANNTKNVEKRRIYSRLGGVSAQDVTGKVI